MYQEGVCPDYSYSFAGKPPPFPVLFPPYPSYPPTPPPPDHIVIYHYATSRHPLTLPPSIHLPSFFPLGVGKPPPTPGLIMDYIERHLLNNGRTVTMTTTTDGNSATTSSTSRSETTSTTSGTSSSSSSSGNSAINADTGASTGASAGAGSVAGGVSSTKKQELAIDALTLAYTVYPTSSSSSTVATTPTPTSIQHELMMAQQYKQALASMHDKVSRPPLPRPTH